MSWKRWAAVGVAVLFVLTPPAAPGGLVDHHPWDQLLRRYVKDGGLDYAGLEKDKPLLESYLASLDKIEPEKLSKNEQLSFWVNAYNAFVVKGVLNHWPLTSVKDVRGFFDRIRYRVGGRELTLNEIEEEARKLGDFRIHFALVCASRSCPPLRIEAYQPDRIQTQLDDHSRLFLGDPERGLRLEGQTLWASKIFQWYGRDFVGSSWMGLMGARKAEALLRALRPHLSPELVQATEGGELALKFMGYDWSLNARTP